MWERSCEKACSEGEMGRVSTGLLIHFSFFVRLACAHAWVTRPMACGKHANRPSLCDPPQDRSGRSEPHAQGL